jgi:hypothetical protein
MGHTYAPFKKAERLAWASLSAYIFRLKVSHLVSSEDFALLL